MAGGPAQVPTQPPTPTWAQCQAQGQAQLQGPASAPVVDHRSVADFLELGAAAISAAADLRMLFIDHSVGQNISEGLDCTASASLEAAPNRCRRFEHVVPAFSADPSHFRFGRQYDRSRWIYHYGASSYWREWPAEIESLLASSGPWDVVIPMPSYLVAPNGGWQPIEELEARHPGIIVVYATSSLPRGAAGGTQSDLVMQEFNAQARAYALRHGKPFLDVADLLSHDYAGNPCYDNRDGIEYCQAPGRCENLPDDGYDIPAICPHYTTELYGGHLGSVSGGALRMSQAVWLLMARLAAYRGGPTPTTGLPTPSPSATAEATQTAWPPTPSPSATAEATQTAWLPTPNPSATAEATQTAWLPTPNPSATDRATETAGPPITAEPGPSPSTAPTHAALRRVHLPFAGR